MVVYEGDHAIEFSTDVTGILTFISKQRIDSQEYSSLDFVINPVDTEALSLWISGGDHKRAGNWIDVSAYIVNNSGLKNGWEFTSIPMSVLNPTGDAFNNLEFMLTGDTSQKIYLDEIVLVKAIK